ncbi:MAG: drug/metabolite transporter (DMT)-like permease [Parasphingorhabdus sp.]|jgi:drug/metabolite transporter (DMT)-like permease
MHTTNKQRLSPELIGVGMVLLSALVFGVAPSAGKIAYQEGANPITVVFTRCVIGALGLGIYLYFRKLPFRIELNHLIGMSRTGFTQMLLTTGILGSVAYIDVSLTVLIIFFHPFLVALIDHFYGDNRFSLKLFLIIACAIGGLALALSVNFQNVSPLGIGMAVVGMLGATAMLVLMVKDGRRIGVLTANFYMMCWASAFVLLGIVIATFTSLIAEPAFPQSSLGWWAMLTAAVASTIAYGAFFIGADIIGSTRASIISISEPIVVILFAILLLNEWLSLAQWCGVTIVVVSLLLMELGVAKKLS